MKKQVLCKRKKSCIKQTIYSIKNEEEIVFLPKKQSTVPNGKEIIFYSKAKIHYIKELIIPKKFSYRSKQRLFKTNKKQLHHCLSMKKKTFWMHVKKLKIKIFTSC